MMVPEDRFVARAGTRFTIPNRGQAGKGLGLPGRRLGSPARGEGLKGAAADYASLSGLRRLAGTGLAGGSDAGACASRATACDGTSTARPPDALMASAATCGITAGTGTT